MAHSNAGSRSEVFEMLKEDHKRAKKAFRDFSKLEQEGDSRACRELAMQTCRELQLHMRLEEDVFYPAARGGLDEEDLVDEAEVEHDSAKTLIEQLQTLSPDDPKFAATFNVLGEYVKHHLKEEEGEMFERLNRAKIDWDGVLEEMLAHRMELESELSLASEDAEAALAAMPPAARGQGTLAPAKTAR